MRLSRKGQSTYEFALVVIVLVAALISMQVYIKRAVQGRLKDSIQQSGEDFYAPRETTGTTVTQTTIEESRESELQPGIMFIGDDIQYGHTNTVTEEHTESREDILPAVY
ncbi:MAG: hypothetical protein C4533_08170 [Candidatus Omnitrophota bacterium]|jgi:hypothetical protein|nr:MAG: hypothetical protein C4533_08170 [Candidatus Omnitrophota bacterium]